MDFEKPLVDMENQLDRLKKDPLANQADIRKEIEWLEGQLKILHRRTYSNLTAWQKVSVARHPDRPHFSAYLKRIFSDWHELHVDRAFKDDPAVIGGLATVGKQKVVVVGQEKGADTRDRLRRNFGMPHPEGYRKAIRLFELAGKFGLPLVTFMDTPGAYPGVGAEERGQAGAIAECLRVLSALPVPVVAVNIGEGGSGGALAFGVANHIIMLENAYYSVITPEGCASILWQDQANAAEAAEALSLTADKLLKMGIIDLVIDEPLGGAHHGPDAVAARLGEAIESKLEELTLKSANETTAERYERFRRIGSFQEDIVN
jgi:acetyl-CoA carboxylase carboxyl transferase subunit alpha